MKVKNKNIAFPRFSGPQWTLYIPAMLRKRNDSRTFITEATRPQLSEMCDIMNQVYLNVDYNPWNHSQWSGNPCLNMKQGYYGKCQGLKRQIPPTIRKHDIIFKVKFKHHNAHIIEKYSNRIKEDWNGGIFSGRNVFFWLLNMVDAKLTQSSW